MSKIDDDTVGGAYSQQEYNRALTEWQARETGGRSARFVFRDGFLAGWTARDRLAREPDELGFVIRYRHKGFIEIAIRIATSAGAGTCWQVVPTYASTRAFTARWADVIGRADGGIWARLDSDPPGGGGNSEDRPS